MERKTLHEYRLDKIREMIEIKFCPVNNSTGAKELVRRIAAFVKDFDPFLIDQCPSLSTIQRYWGLTKEWDIYKYDGREGIWIFFARILGYRCWDDFCASTDLTFRYKFNIDHFNYFCNVNVIQRLENRDKIVIGFPPYKYSMLKYHDDMEFEVLYATQNMHHREGDIIYAEKFILDRTKLDAAGAPEIFYKRFLFNYDFDENEDLIDLSLGELQPL